MRGVSAWLAEVVPTGRGAQSPLSRLHPVSTLERVEGMPASEGIADAHSVHRHESRGCPYSCIVAGWR